METVIRVAIIYIFVLAGLRLMGKREFSQMGPMELVTLLLIPEIVSQGLIREDFSITNALIGVSTLFILVFVNSTLTHLSKRAETVIEGPPTVLAHRGELVEDAMDKERVSPDELFSEMHKAGLDRLEQVRWAILEGDGKIAIVPETGRSSPKKVKEEMAL